MQLTQLPLEQIIYIKPGYYDSPKNYKLYSETSEHQEMLQLLERDRDTNN